MGCIYAISCIIDRLTDIETAWTALNSTSSRLTLKRCFYSLVVLSIQSLLEAVLMHNKPSEIEQGTKICYEFGHFVQL